MLTPEKKAEYNDKESSDPNGDDRQGSEEDEEGEQCKGVKLCCSFDKVCHIVRDLKDKQKVAITTCGFGNFLREDYSYVNMALVSYLIHLVNPSSSTLTLDEKCFRITPEIFEKVMAINDGGENVITEVYKDISYQKCGWKL